MTEEKKNKPMSIYEKWRIDSSYDKPLGFSDQDRNDEVNKNRKNIMKDSAFKLLSEIETLDQELNSSRKLSKRKIRKIKDRISTLDSEVNNLITGEQLEENLDEGLPSESGKYDGMSYEEVLKRALQMESDAVEINLMLLEMAPQKDRKRFIEIANDENDHSLIYLDILNSLQKSN